MRNDFLWQGAGFYASRNMGNYTETVKVGDANENRDDVNSYARRNGYGTAYLYMSNTEVDRSEYYFVVKS